MATPGQGQTQATKDPKNLVARQAELALKLQQGYTNLLVTLVKTGDKQQVELALKQIISLCTINPNCSVSNILNGVHSEQKITPLAAAAFIGNLEIVNLLLSVKEVNQEIKITDQKATRLIHVREKQPDGTTAALYAAKNGHPTVLQALHAVDNRIFEDKDADGRTALHLAIASPTPQGTVEKIQELTKLEAKQDTPNNSSGLSVTVTGETKESQTKEDKNSKESKRQDNETKSTASATTTTSEQPQITFQQMIVIKDEKGFTPMQVACAQEANAQTIAVIKLLISSGCPVNQTEPWPDRNHPLVFCSAIRY